MYIIGGRINGINGPEIFQGTLHIDSDHRVPPWGAIQTDSGSYIAQGGLGRNGDIIISAGEFAYKVTDRYGDEGNRKHLIGVCYQGQRVIGDFDMFMEEVPDGTKLDSLYMD
ncbi:MAG: hypothetical protein J4431_03920 [Candidatus Aenigmarchaeota archaeon]|nr:hypothetical protein [Candidatus Aenigmarchaeota archaeon]